MPTCLNGHARFQPGCGACETGNYLHEGPASGGAIGPRRSARPPSRPTSPSCPQCDFVSDTWHGIYDHMVESHPGTMVSARIQQHLEYLLGESRSQELDEDELSALFFPPGQVDESPSIFSRHAFVPQQQDPHLCAHCSNHQSARIHSNAEAPQPPQEETPVQAGQDPNREWSSRRHFQGMYPREMEAERQRALRLTKRKGPSKWAVVTVAVVSVLAVVIAAGYFLAERGSEETPTDDVPVQPAEPSRPESDAPSPDSGPNPVPAPTPDSTPISESGPAPSTPTPIMPMPTLTLNELFALVDTGQWTEQQAVAELERREEDNPTEFPTLVPSTAAPSSATVGPDSSGRGSPEWIATLESAVHQQVNFERQKNFLPVLDHDATLAAIALAHSQDMALNNFFEHENLAGQTAADRGNAVGYTCVKDYGSFFTAGISENIFQGYIYLSFGPRGRTYITLSDLAFEIVDGWMNSPGHRENILTETYDREGIGVAIGDEESVWVTQNFC